MPCEGSTGPVHDKIGSFYGFNCLFHEIRIFFFQPEHASCKIKARFIIRHQILHDMVSISIKLNESDSLIFYKLTELFGCQDPESMAPS